MAHYIFHKEGLRIGSSTALNFCAVVKTAYTLGWNGKQNSHLSENEKKQKRTLMKEDKGDLVNGGNILTIICDQGSRHLTRFWNQEYCEEHYQIKWPQQPQLLTLTSFLNFKDVRLLQNRYRYTVRNQQLHQDANFLWNFFLYSITTISVGAACGTFYLYLTEKGLEQTKFLGHLGLGVSK